MVNGHGNESRDADVLVDANLNAKDAAGQPWGSSNPTLKVIANSAQAAYEARHAGSAYTGPHPIGQRVSVQSRDGVRFVAIRDLPNSEVLVLINRD